jgi:DNA-binding transcriptional ArsR family regulator
MPKNQYSCDCNVIHQETVDHVKAEMPPEEVFQRIATFFKVMGDPTRAKILWVLDTHEMCVCDLANALGMTKSAVSHQLGFLRNANLVSYRRDGKTVFYALADDHVRGMLESGLEHIHE